MLSLATYLNMFNIIYVPTANLLFLCVPRLCLYVCVFVCACLSHLAQNPFICDCHLKWLADYLQDNPIETSGARCTSPRRLANKRIGQIKSKKFRCSGINTLLCDHFTPETDYFCFRTCTSWQIHTNNAESPLSIVLILCLPAGIFPQPLFTNLLSSRTHTLTHTESAFFQTRLWLCFTFTLFLSLH